MMSLPPIFPICRKIFFGTACRNYQFVHGKYYDFLDGTIGDYACYIIQGIDGVEMEKMKQRVTLELNQLKLLLIKTAHHK